MPQVQPSRLLRTALWIDAIGSAPVGLSQVAFTAATAAATGLSATLLAAAGVFTLAYVGGLTWLARQPTMPLTALRMIVVGNAGWAIGCAMLAATQPGLTPLGVGYLLLQTVAVGAFSALQAAGLARSPRRPSASAQPA